MSETVTNTGLLSDEEEDVIEDKEEELRLQESIRKDLLQEFTDTNKSGKLTRESISHNREPMKVYLRVRPFTDTEVEEGESQACMTQENTTSLIMRAPKNSFAFKSSQRGLGEMTHKFTFSKIFDEDTSQKSFFDETMLATAKDFIDGQNCLVFTYGVTNAGKTYTIQGVPQDGGILPRSLDVIFNSIESRHYTSLRLKPRYFCDVVKLSEKQMKREEDVKNSVLSLGCPVPTQSLSQTVLEGESIMTDDSLNSDTSRASFSAQDNSQDASKLSESKLSTGTTKDVDVTGVADQIFHDEINARIPDDTVVNVDAQGPVKFSIWVSFAEIYNECIYDLLEPLPKEKKVRRQVLKLAEDKNNSIYIKGLKQLQVNSADEAYRILKIGQRNLSIAATKLNHNSSRSHCIFSVKILRVVDVADPHVARVSHLSFCDLAGSERYTRTQNTGDRLKEAGNINTSLLTLGKCIHALRYNQNHPKAHPKIIPFRESKLTRLFQSFFLGRGKASMIVNVNQCASGFDETMHVLKFSATAKQVTTVTSKLDTKWKEPARKSTRPLRNVSLALNQALDARIKGQRPSVPWATPGTIAQVMKETGHRVSLEDTVFEEEEEADVEDEGETDDDEMEVGALTPVPTKDENAAKIQNELLAVIDVLKQKLVEAKAEKFHLEAKIREEVCQEMAQQLVEIEQDFNDRLEEDKQRAEEVFEKRLEIYAKSVKKTNKRQRLDEDGADTEQVSVEILAAEQNKVRDRDAQIEKLTLDLENAEQALKDFEDETHEETKKKEEEYKSKMAEMEERIEEQTAGVTDSETLRNQLNDAELKLLSYNKEVEDLRSQLECAQHSLQKLEEDKNNEIQNREEEYKRKLAAMSEEQQTMLTENDNVGHLENQLSEAQTNLKEKGNEVERLQGELDSAKQALKEFEASLQQEMSTANGRYEVKMEEMTARVVKTSEDMAELQKLLNHSNEKVKELQDTIALKDEKLSSNGEDWIKKEKELSSQNEQLLEQIKDFEGELVSQHKELEESMKTNEELEKKIGELSQQSGEKEQEKCDRILGLEKEIKELKEARDQRDNLVKELEDRDSKIGELTLEVKDRNKKVEEIEKTLSAQSRDHQQQQDLIHDLEQEVDELKAVHKQKEEIEKEIKERDIQIEDLYAQVEDSRKKMKDLEHTMADQSGDQQEKSDHIKNLEEELNNLREMKTQHEEVDKEIKAKDRQIEDLNKQLEEGQKKIKELEKTMADQLCAEMKMHEEAQQEMRSSLLTHAQQEEEAKKIIEQQEATIEELRARHEQQQQQIEKLEKCVSDHEEKINQLTSSASDKSESIFTSSSSSSSSDDKPPKGTLSKTTKHPSSVSLTSTISTTSYEDDDVILIEPEDQEGYKAGRLSRVEIDATPLQKKPSKKGRSTRATKTSQRSTRKRGGDADDNEDVSAKKARDDDEGGTKGRSRRTRATSKTNLNEEIENEPLDTSCASTNQTGSSQRRGPLARINEYLQNSPIGKSAKRLVETATGSGSPTQDPEPPQEPSPKAREMDTFVPSLVPENKRRKRKLYKTDISAPFECSPYEIGKLTEAKPAESTGAVITRKLRSRTKKNY